MRKLRRALLGLSSVFCFLTSLLSLACFLALAFNKQQIGQEFFKTYANVIADLNLAFSTMLNIMLVYFLTACVANGLFGYVYAKICKSNSYYAFFQNKNGLWFLCALQMFVGFPYIATICLLVSLLIPTNVHEKHELKQQQDLIHYRKLISSDPKLLSMSIQIGFLKQLLKTRQIDYVSYIKKVNDIITEGVQR